MQQRQLRLGDILDDYCPRERRVTNHAVVAMIGADVKQTRCTTCDTEHEFKHAKVPRQRRKADTPAALYAQVAAGAPKRVAHDAVDEQPAHEDESTVAEEIEIGDNDNDNGGEPAYAQHAESDHPSDSISNDDANQDDANQDDDAGPREVEEGPVHRPLIRASLPRPEGQQPPARPIPEFTIRQPGGRQGRFRPRHQRGGQPGQQFGGNRGNGNFAGPPRGVRQGGGGHSQGGGRRHDGPGRRRSK